MNWGKGIAIALSGFIVFITILVIGFFSHSVDLESEDYYQKELIYGDEIKAIENASSLKEKVVMRVTEDHILIQQPNDAVLENVQLSFQRPNDEKDDVRYEITGEKQFIIRRNALKAGVYNVSISYLKGGQQCLQKEQIYL